MGIITKPYTFASGRVIDGTQINANFDALIAGVGDTTTLRPTLASLGAVAGPTSFTDNAIVRADGVTGKLVQNSWVSIDDGGGILNTPSYFEKVFSGGVVFPNAVANQAIDIRLGNCNIWGYIEVEITSSYFLQDSSGKLTKVFAVGLNGSGSIFSNESRVSDAMGSIIDNVSIGNLSWDAANTTFRIPISHIVSTGNAYSIKIKLFSAAGGAESTATTISISACYTLTALAKQYIYYTGNVGIGTAAPTSKLHVVGLPAYANNAAAIAGGLTAGAFYRTGLDPDPVCVVH